jgi:hypothetical protein
MESHDQFVRGLSRLFEIAPALLLEKVCLLALGNPLFRLLGNLPASD